MKKIGFFALALAAGLFLTAGIARAAVINVPADFATIQAAVNAAASGDTIMVAAGTYNESVTVNKGVIIQGAGALKTLVISPSAASGGFVVIAPNVTISGFDVVGGTNSGISGILIGGTSIGDLTDYGVSDVLVSQCIVEKSAIGITVWRSTGTKLANNIVRYNTAMSGGMFDGIGILVTSDGFDILNTRMVHNQVNDNDSYGIAVWGSSGAPSFDGTMMTNNRLFDNGAADLTAPSNNNKFGFYFNNAAGSITLTGNKVLATSPTGNEIVSVNAPGLKGGGNLIFKGVRGQFYGGSSPLHLH